MVKLIIIAGLCAVELIGLAIATLPPTARDSLIYHLAYPKLYIQHGQIYELPFAFYSYYPMNTEILYLAPLYLGKDFIASYIHMSFGLLTALLIYRYLKDKVGTTYAALGCFLFLSTPIVIRLSTIPYADLSLAFYSTGAVLSVLKWRENKSSKWLGVSALYAGLAAGTKYNGLYIPLLLLFMVANASKNEKPFKTVLIFLSISILVASPWYIRNAIWTGNPFYPLFFNIFGGLKIPEQPTVPILLKRQLFYDENWLEIALVPIRVFFQGRDDDMQHFDGSLNPLLLLFLPFAFRYKRQDLRYMGFFSLLYLFLVYFTADMQARFLLPILPVLAIMSTIGIKESIESSGRIKAVSTFIVISLLSLNLNYLADYVKKKAPLAYLTGRETRDEYLLKHLRGYESYLYINRNLPSSSKILMSYVGDRGYYMDRDYYYNSYLNGQPLKDALDGAKKVSDVAGRFFEKGLTHILLDEKLLNEYLNNNLNEEQYRLFTDFVRERLRLLHSADGYLLFEIKKMN